MPGTPGLLRARGTADVREDAEDAGAEEEPLHIRDGGARRPPSAGLRDNGGVRDARQGGRTAAPREETP